MVFQRFFLLSGFRSNHPQVFCKKGVLKNIAKFTGKHLCQSLFFNTFFHRTLPVVDSLVYQMKVTSKLNTCKKPEKNGTGNFQFITNYSFSKMPKIWTL